MGEPHLCNYAFMRGDISLPKFDFEFEEFSKKKHMFTDWIPHKIAYSHCSKTRGEVINSGTLLSNHYAVKEIFKRLGEQFTALFRKVRSYFNPIESIFTSIPCIRDG